MAACVRRLLGLFAISLASASCGGSSTSASIIRVTVTTSGGGVLAGIDHLSVYVSNAGMESDLQDVDPPTKPYTMPPPLDFTIGLGEGRTGAAVVHVDAIGTGGRVLGRGMNSVDIREHGIADVTVLLPVTAPDGGAPDLAMPGDGAASDLATLDLAAPDLATPDLALADLTMTTVDQAKPADLVTVPDLVKPPDLVVLADLATVADLAKPPDLTVLPDMTLMVADLAKPPDLTVLPDLSSPPDLWTGACVKASDCAPNQACNLATGKCGMACGSSSYTVCNGGCCNNNNCATGFTNQACGYSGGACTSCNNGYFCDTGVCCQNGSICV